VFTNPTRADASTYNGNPAAPTFAPSIVAKSGRFTSAPPDGRSWASYESVNHGAEEYVRGDVTTNTVEGYFSIFKRGMKGVYQHASKKHLHRYAAEFAFRYSNRSALGSDDVVRADNALLGVSGKRLTYQGPNTKTA
jgi:hypothetical protein